LAVCQAEKQHFPVLELILRSIRYLGIYLSSPLASIQA
jgi:hypothetical protein